jgi:DNA invertase Pin-like site-specific DNA recombinase
MFGAASRREFDVLVFWSFDRLSRADQTKREKMGHLVS